MIDFILLCVAWAIASIISGAMYVIGMLVIGAVITIAVMVVSTIASAFKPKD